MSTTYTLELKVLLKEGVGLESLSYTISGDIEISGSEVSIFLGDYTLSDFEDFNRNICDQLAPFVASNWIEGRLKIGVFYDLSETVVFFTEYGSELMSLLVDMKLSVECVGYPCER